jgi:hypothetical protein
VNYLDKYCEDTLLFTIQAKCAVLINQKIVEEKINRLNKERLAVFKSYFNQKDLLKSVKINQGVAVIPFNGYSFYKIEYKGEFPENLIKAYRKMNLLNNESPRDKYKRKIN